MEGIARRDRYGARAMSCETLCGMDAASRLRIFRVRAGRSQLESAKRLGSNAAWYAVRTPTTFGPSLYWRSFSRCNRHCCLAWD